MSGTNSAAVHADALAALLAAAAESCRKVKGDDSVEFSGWTLAPDWTSLGGTTPTWRVGFNLVGTAADLARATRLGVRLLNVLHEGVATLAVSEAAWRGRVLSLESSPSVDTRPREGAPGGGMLVPMAWRVELVASTEVLESVDRVETIEGIVRGRSARREREFAEMRRRSRSASARIRSPRVKIGPEKEKRPPADPPAGGG